MTPESTLRERFRVPPRAKFVGFVCTACGSDYPGTTSTARFLAGSRGDPETPGLCWVCRRLRALVAAEQARERAYWAAIEKHWTE